MRRDGAARVILAALDLFGAVTRLVHYSGFSTFCFAALRSPIGLCGVGGVFNIRRQTSSRT